MCRKSKVTLFLCFLLQLAVEVIHNMRTIKQLSVEKEVLLQYLEFIHQRFMLVSQVLYLYKFSTHTIYYRLSRKFFLASSVLYGVIWVLTTYLPAFLYWRALILFEQHKIKAQEIIM